MNHGTHCCACTTRRLGIATRDGTPVHDLHRHHQGWRGYTVHNGAKRSWEWTIEGRASLRGETGGDLVGLA